MHVLVADDALPIRMLFTRILKSMGLTVTGVGNGDAVYEECMNSKVDLLLLDLDMPGRDPYCTLELLRTNPKTQDVPILVVSGNDDPAELTKLLESGATDFIVKPTNLTLLKNRVKAYLLSARSPVAL